MPGKILVTGGTGYIGSHTVVELIKEGYEVVVIDDLSNSDKSVLEAIEKTSGKRPIFYQLDLKDKPQLFEILEKESIESIIHFAASKAVGESVQLPLKYYQNNLISMMNLLEGMEKYDVKNMVFSSSCTVYGEPDQLPVTENSPLKKAQSPYGNTKKMCEDFMQDFVIANPSFNAIALRYFNPVGAHESGNLGENPKGMPNNLMPIIVDAALGKIPSLKVFGTDYNTPDGTCLRDYIHVQDLARAHVNAVDRLEKHYNKNAFECFNIGTGNGFSVLEIIKSFEKVSGLKLNYELVERRPGDVEQIYADPSMAKSELGWVATKSLDEMTGSAWEWGRLTR